MAQLLASSGLTQNSGELSQAGFIPPSSYCSNFTYIVQCMLKDTNALAPIVVRLVLLIRIMLLFKKFFIDVSNDFIPYSEAISMLYDRCRFEV